MNGWTDAQMQIVAQTVQYEIEDSRLAQKVIPEYTLPSSARAVSADTFDEATGRVDDVTQLPLEEGQDPFTLTRAQAEDEDLSSALVTIRRSAQRLAKDHDTRVFKVSIRDPIDNPVPPANFNPVEQVPRVGESGEGMVSATAAAVATLDAAGYRTGYVIVAGQNIYRLLYLRDVGAADLPVVAVRGLLADGPVYRSDVLDGDEALVLSVGAGRIDRAVAVAPVTEFLRVQQESGQEIRQWRLYERFLTRFKETKSVVLLRLTPAAVAAPPAPAPAVAAPAPAPAVAAPAPAVAAPAPAVAAPAPAPRGSRSRAGRPRSNSPAQ